MINIKNKKIKFGIIISILVTITIAIILVFINKLENQSRYLLKQNIKAEMIEANEEISESINDNILLLEKVTKSIRGNIPYIKDVGEIPEEFFKVLKDSGKFEFISVIDSNGILKVNNNKFIDVKNEDFYIKRNDLSKPNIFYGDISDIVSGEKLIYTIPVNNDTGYCGSLIVISNIKEVEKDIIKKINNKKISFYIINEEGKKVLSNNEYSEFDNFYEYLAHKNVGLKSYVDEISYSIKNKSKEIIEVNNGEKNGYIYHSKIADNSDWQAISYVADENIFNTMDDINTKLLLSIGVLSVLIIFEVIYILIIEIEKQKQIKDIYSTDVLTGIGNNSKFIADTTRILKENRDKEYIIAIVDISRFKYINYIYGYDHGDNLLKSIAKKLMVTFYGDETCARITGDKFIILAKYNKIFHDKFIKMLDGMLRDYERNSHRIKFDFNCGFYILKNREDDIGSAIENANLAWSYCKQENIKYQYYNNELIEGLLKEEVIVSSMRKALDDHEFIIYMQPKMDLVNKRICGAEALVRWVSPKFGFTPLEEFIPIFEKNGFIVDLDFYVLEEILKYLKDRIDNNERKFTISINQSRETLRSEGYIQRLENIINKYGIPKELIELEVTESVFVLNYNELYKKVDEIRNLGIKVAIDDFGVGYSSLNLLKDINIDILKLDKSFLFDNEVTTKGKTIIGSIIEMSKKLNIEVVCEGVEVKEQSDILCEIGCTTAQGYYYGRPMTIMDFDKTIKDTL